MKIGIDTTQNSTPTGSFVAHPLAIKLSVSSAVIHPIDLSLNISGFLGGLYRLLVDLGLHFLATVGLTLEANPKGAQDESRSHSQSGPVLGKQRG
jgi:hypothetical protein